MGNASRRRKYEGATEDKDQEHPTVHDTLAQHVGRDCAGIIDAYAVGSFDFDKCVRILALRCADASKRGDWDVYRRLSYMMNPLRVAEAMTRPSRAFDIESGNYSEHMAKRYALNRDVHHLLYDSSPWECVQSPGRIEWLTKRRLARAEEARREYDDRRRKEAERLSQFTRSDDEWANRMNAMMNQERALRHYW